MTIFYFCFDERIRVEIITVVSRYLHFYFCLFLGFSCVWELKSLAEVVIYSSNKTVKIVYLQNENLI